MEYYDYFETLEAAKLYAGDLIWEGIEVLSITEAEGGGYYVTRFEK